ncbi:MAG: cytochrome c oxidase subunit I [Solirubrobacteraceae bacterium]
MSTQAVAAPPLGFLGLIGATDHKRIAKRTAVVAFAFFGAGGILALLMRAQLATPASHLIGTDAYDALFTMHGSTMIYLFMVPMAVALGVYFVPLQVGAAEIAGPRIALAGFWLYVSGGLTMWSGYLTVNGPGKAGWTAFDPLSDTPHTPGVGMDFWIFGVMLVTLGTLLLAACVLATIVARRAPGMTMLRMAPFTWTMLVTCLMVVAAFPVLVVAMGLLWVQREFGGVFNPGGGPIAYQNLFWFYGHPVVYVMFFPFVGAVAEVVSVHSGRRFFGHRAFAVSLLAFTALSTSVWAHHMFTTGQVANRYFALTSTALAIPAGIEYFDMIATLAGGSIRLRTPMLFALGFLAQFLIGGLTGILLGSPPVNYAEHATYFVIGHFHYTLFAGSLFGFFAGVYHWFPKVTGVMLGERLGRLHFWVMALAANLTFFPMLILGWEGMRRRVDSYPASSGWQLLNDLSTAGAALIAVSVLIFLVNLVRSLRHPIAAGPDPWGGHTLEWATSSPPPRHNFDALPPVRSPAPLLDLREAAAAKGAPA